MENISKPMHQGWSENKRRHALTDGRVDAEIVREQLQFVIRMFSQMTRITWALGGMTVGVLITVIALQALPRWQASLPGNPLAAWTRSGPTPDVSSDLLLASRASQQRMDTLIQDVQTLTAAVVDLQGEAAELHPVGNAAPGTTAATMPANTVAGEDAVALAALPAPASGSNVRRGRADPTATQGEWVVNLASLPSRQAADELLAQAQAQQIPGVLRKITVNGKSFWRVQATGFESFTEAKAHIGSLEQKLATRGAWVMERTQ